MGYTFEYPTTTIANGASQSGIISCGSQVPTHVLVPSSWTAANLSFQASPTDGGTYTNLSTGGLQYGITVLAGSWNAIDATVLAGHGFFKVTSVSTSAIATPVNQGGDRALVFACRRTDSA